MKSSRGIIVIGLLLGGSAFAQELVSSEIEKSGVVDSVYGLESVFVENQYRYLPVSPPMEDVFVQSLESVVPVNWKNFPTEFTKQMYAEMDANGYPLYRVSVYEDPATRETVFLNMYGKEVFRLPPEKGYDPYVWQEEAFGVESYLALDELSRWIYDPAHIAIELVLIPEVFQKDYLADQKAEASALEAMPMVMMTMEGGEEDTPAVEIVFGMNGMVELQMDFPEAFGHRQMEIIASEELLGYKPWVLALDRFPVDGGDTLLWVDAASTNSTRFYYLNWADDDSDLDGYSDLRERLVMDTNPYDFDVVDNDGDGMQDSYEMRYFHTLAYSGSDDPDQDGLANNEEMVLHSSSVEVFCSPVLWDTDGDGVSDGVEVAWGGNPSDPTNLGGGDSGGLLDTGGSIAVSMSLVVGNPVSSEYLFHYTMMVDGNTISVLQNDDFAVDTCYLEKGNSYTWSVELEDACGYSGAIPAVYEATLSSSGMVPETDTFGGTEGGSSTVYVPLFSSVEVIGDDLTCNGNTYSSTQAFDVVVSLSIEPSGCPAVGLSWEGGSEEGYLMRGVSLQLGESETLTAFFGGETVFQATFECQLSGSPPPPPPPPLPPEDLPPDEDPPPPSEPEYSLEILGPSIVTVGGNVEYQATVTESHGWPIPQRTFSWDPSLGFTVSGSTSGQSITLTAPSAPSGSIGDKIITCTWGDDLSVPKYVTILKVGLTAAYSDQIPGRECNALPGQNPMYMGARADNRGSLQVDAAVQPQQINNIGMVGVRHGTSILASEPIQTPRTPIDFAPAGGRELYEVVAGCDLNTDGTLQISEVTEVLVDQLMLFTQGDYNYSDGMLTVFAAGTWGVGSQLLEAFIDDTVPPNVVNTATTISSIELPHPIGASWDASGSAVTRLYTYVEGTDVSNDVEEDPHTIAALQASLGQHQTEVQNYFAPNPTVNEHTFGPWNWQTNGLDFDGLALQFAFGHVNVAGTVSVTVRRSDLAVTHINYTGSFTDIYDFNYTGAYPSEHGATVQAGFPTQGVGGRVFRDRVEFSRDTTNFNYDFN